MNQVQWHKLILDWSEFSKNLKDRLNLFYGFQVNAFYYRWLHFLKKVTLTLGNSVKVCHNKNQFTCLPKKICQMFAQFELRQALGWDDRTLVVFVNDYETMRGNFLFNHE